MKKITLILIAFVFFEPIAQGATLTSESYTLFIMSQTRDLTPITITATQENEITAKNGIDLFLPPEAEMLWDAGPTLTVTGKAVNNQKIGANIVPAYKNNYSILHIPVLATFNIGDDVTVTGLRMRAYDHPFGQMNLQADFNGDGLSDAQNENRITVQNIQGVDLTTPYPPAGLNVTLSADLKSITITWQPSPDYDQTGSNLDRVRIRSGISQSKSLISSTTETSFTDTDIQVGDKITYSITANDKHYISESLEKTIEVRSFAVEPPPATPETNPELAQLTQLFGYYKTRQAIKCQPDKVILAGREGVSVTDSACLWARIDLVYAQTLLNRFDVNVALSARDLELMALRIVWPEKRYQNECVGVIMPDKSCPALEKSIKRAHYFIDGK